eukprot:8909089-Ditylum_brightwellii.AAC.1
MFKLIFSIRNKSNTHSTSDMVLIKDPEFRKIVEIYAKDEDEFFKDFASAFSKLLELGVSFPASKPWYKFW